MTMFRREIFFSKNIYLHRTSFDPCLTIKTVEHEHANSDFTQKFFENLHTTTSNQKSA